MSVIRSYIRKDSKEGALWLVVERGEDSANLDNILGMFRDEDGSNNVAYPILDEEVLAIKKALDKYLIERELEKGVSGGAGTS